LTIFDMLADSFFCCFTALYAALQAQQSENIGIISTGALRCFTLLYGDCFTLLYALTARHHWIFCLMPAS